MNVKDKIYWQIQNIYLKLIIGRNRLFKKYQPKDSIVVLGSGRSGTTWVAEVLSNILDAKILDEPLKRNDSKNLLKIGLNMYDCIPEGCEDWKEVNKLFDKLFTGRWFNPNHIHMNTSKLISTKVWIIKFIRLHFLLPWLVNRYPEIKPIYIIRNPYSLVSSQMKHGAWNNNISTFKVPDNIHFGELIEKHKHIYDKIHTNIEYKTFEWCITNNFLLKHEYNRKKWLVITYEELIMNPNVSFEKIFKFIGREEYFSPDILSKYIDLPSISNVDLQESVSKQLSKWKDYLQEDDIISIRRMLKKFELEDLYLEDNINLR